MSAPANSQFAAEYNRTLAAYLKAGGADACRLGELGDLARSLQIPVHEIVANHADSLFTCLPADAQASDYKAATEFLRTLCEVAAAAAATEREQFLRKLAHALRTPLTTLRLSLQVGVGRVERGEPLTAATLQKSIAQIDKIAAQIAEIFKDFQPRPRSPDQPRP